MHLSSGSSYRILSLYGRAVKKRWAQQLYQLCVCIVKSVQNVLILLITKHEASPLVLRLLMYNEARWADFWFASISCVVHNYLVLASS